jgi:hypothetical protein
MFSYAYLGKQYSFSYECETGNYFLHANEYRHSAYLKNNDAKIVEQEVDKIDALPETPIKTAILIENLISSYL